MLPIWRWDWWFRVSRGWVLEGSTTCSGKLQVFSIIPFWQFQAYRHIFTSPSSAADENLNKASKSRRRDVASKVGLNSHVTPRSIAYAATQVCFYYLAWLSFIHFICKLLFSLNTASDWVHQHAGFHYPSFYNFIVDFFEEAQDMSSKKSVDDLLQWWNQYVFFLSVYDCVQLSFL